MSKKAIVISSQSLAEIIHMELLKLEVHNADEIYKLVSEQEGSLLLMESEGIEILER